MEKEKDKKPTPKDMIIESLREKGQLRRTVSTLTSEIFTEIKQHLKNIQEDLSKELKKNKIAVDLGLSDRGHYEVEMKLNEELIIFVQHTNVFTFDEDHFVWRLPYIQEDQQRANCGMIQIYNFLTDSFKYQRHQDVGYLIARIFVNKEKHFFVEGKRQLGFLYNDFENAVLDSSHLQEVLESTILYTLNFDLLVPPYEMVKEITLQQKHEQQGSSTFQTGKRLGFRFSADEGEVK